jgi:hypothetical protein
MGQQVGQCSEECACVECPQNSREALVLKACGWQQWEKMRRPVSLGRILYLVKQGTIGQF